MDLCYLIMIILELCFFYHESVAKSYKKNAKKERNILFSQVFGRSHDPDFNRNVTELIRSKGYSCEEHYIQTRDGFILGLQRIQYNKPHRIQGSKRPVVLLQHGLLDSSATWVINFPSQSLDDNPLIYLTDAAPKSAKLNRFALALQEYNLTFKYWKGYLLSDAGCDVWLGNVRGNTYSRRHVKLKPSDANFWNWSWDEMAKYDIPAMLGYISTKTGSRGINYIGHSQGTTVALASFSENQQVAQMVKRFIGLAPVAMVGHIDGFFKYLAESAEIPEMLFKVLGIHEFLPLNCITTWIAGRLCDKFFFKDICQTVILKGGLDSNNANLTRFPVYAAHDPAGSSVKNLVHFAQMYRSKKFQMFDYKSPDMNILHYNQTTPPEYELNNMKVPTYLFSGGKDQLSDPEDVKLLVTNLTSLMWLKQISKYQHLDFTWGLDAADMVYKKIIQILLS